MTPVLSLFFEESNLLSADFSLVLMLVMFVIFIYVLDAMLFKPLTKVLDERERLTSGSIGQADKASHDYEKLLANYEEKIRAAKTENYQTLEGKRKVALEERTKKLTQVKGEIAQQLEVAKNDIATTSTQAREKLASDARSMAELITSTLLKRPLGGSSR